MTALYRVGRQGDALAAFRRARHSLVEQLGVEPGPALRELESLILDHDERLQRRRDSRRTHRDRATRGDAGRATSPIGSGRLIGRDDDLRCHRRRAGPDPRS